MALLFANGPGLGLPQSNAEDPFNDKEISEDILHRGRRASQIRIKEICDLMPILTQPDLLDAPYDKAWSHVLYTVDKKIKTP